MKEYLPILKACPLFGRIDEKDLLRLLSCLNGQIESYPKDRIILRQGEPAVSFGVVLKGKVQIIRGDISGQHAIFSLIGPGEVFGESYACSALPASPVSAVAGEETVVLLLRHNRVVRACSKGCISHSSLIVSLLQLVAEKNLFLSRKLDIVMRRSTREKILAYLHYQQELAGSERFWIPFDRQELADFLGVDRSAMSTELSRLRKDGVIDFYKNEFTMPPADHSVSCERRN